MDWLEHVCIYAYTYEYSHIHILHTLSSLNMRLLFLCVYGKVMSTGFIISHKVNLNKVRTLEVLQDTFSEQNPMKIETTD